MSKRPTKATRPHVLERRAAVARLYSQGMYAPAIAEALGANVSTVRGDINKIRTDWKAEAVEYFHEARMRQAQELQTLRAELWGQWRASKQASRERIVSEQPSGEAEAQQRLADPAYAQAIIRAMEREAKLLGLDSDQELVPPNHTPQADLARERSNVVNLSDEQRARRIAALLDGARARRAQESRG